MSSKAVPAVLFFVIMLLIKCSVCHKSRSSVLEKFSWDCANNASCVHSVAQSIARSYRQREPIDFGLFSIEPVPYSSQHPLARSSKVWDFLNGNAVRVPLGPMVLNLQRSDDADYMEVALLRKVPFQEGRGRGGKKEKKQMQVFIPMFLAANAIGWMMLAIKAVGVLTVKALLVSKLALLVAAAIIVKKLMENATEKMFLQHYPEPPHHHSGYAMPYNMEYAINAHTLPGGDIGPNDVYALQVAHPHTALEHLTGAESSLSHAVEVQNGTHPHLLAAMGGLGGKVKRDDSPTQWTELSMPHSCSNAYMKSKSKLYKYLSPNNPAYLYRKI